MTKESPDSGSISGLAKRWLKTQLKFHGDPIKAAQDRREAEEIEYETRERAEYEAGRTLVNAVTPSSWRERLQSFETQSRLSQQQREARDRAEHGARPRAQVSFQFSGDVTGELKDELPVEVFWPGDEGSWVVLSLEAIEPVSFGVHLFRGLRIALPAVDAISGTPVTLSASVDRYEQYWDPLDAQIWLDSEESSYFWTSGEASPQFWPSQGLTSLVLVFPARDELGRRIRLEGQIIIPAEARS